MVGDPPALSVKVKLLLSTLVRSTCSLKVNTNLSTVPSELLSPVIADTRVGNTVSTVKEELVT